jgi:general secretion pathway protein E/type IV pilus assembly protein PilB
MEPVTLRNFTFASAYGKPYTRQFMSHRGAVKLDENDNKVTVAVVEGSDSELFTFLTGYHIPKKVAFCSVTKAEFAAFIGETTDIEPSPETVTNDANTNFSLDTITQDAPIINIINAICIEAIRLEASDIHIEAQADSVHIRYRIDGVLRIVKKIEKSIFLSIANRIKIMANMNTMEKRLPQDGRMTVTVGGDEIDLRVSIIPIMSGESIVLRIFNKSTKVLTLGELGFTAVDLERIQNCVQKPYGLILLTGPTGSGKTTTLHALLETLPVNDLNIITIEDPVEQLIPGINQVQINEDISLSFDGMLRRVLRQDPNVIMVGEIRDTITAELALRSALTGHLILSTLHTNDSISVIARLQNMGIEPYLIAAVLRCSVAQRLVRKVCPRCAKKTGIPHEAVKLFNKYKIEGSGIYNPAGCEYCKYTGYKGRTVVSEVFIVDPAIEEMIIRGNTSAEIAKCAKNTGMRSMAENALQKVVDGTTSFAEIEREVML